MKSYPQKMRVIHSFVFSVDNSKRFLQKLAQVGILQLFFDNERKTKMSEMSTQNENGNSVDNPSKADKVTIQGDLAEVRFTWRLDRNQKTRNPHVAVLDFSGLSREQLIELAISQVVAKVQGLLKDIASTGGVIHSDTLAEINVLDDIVRASRKNRKDLTQLEKMAADLKASGATPEIIAMTIEAMKKANANLA